MTEEPSPASLEKIPRLSPHVIAFWIATPAAAAGVKGERGKDTEDGKEISEYLTKCLTPFFGAKFIPKITDTKYDFAVMCRHTKKGGYPHPEHSTRAAGYDSCRNFCNIANAYGTGKRST